ncbi:recombination regulator RecX [Rhizobium sp. Root1220]|uniref:recombination regulator RecX n=1 Tax=Rhizobium sp. Root1220 TaxID=1736432 RepID=UPI0006F9883A|nr:recombination regulator RecX [Rhizobium sp. Root1220]KQV81815.1 recombinase RecX [Rhizobium sp. Root1220]
MTDDEVQTDIPTARMLSWARNSAIYRLGRRMMTEKQLFDAIARKARQKFEGINALQVEAVADSAVKFAYGQGALNDVAYAEMSTRAGVRNGKSKRVIAQRLSLKGIDREIATAALEDSDDLFAAVVFARKRSFGPFRRDAPDDKQRAKEVSAFARNGFGFEIGRAVLEMTRDGAEGLIETKRSGNS